MSVNWIAPECNSTQSVSFPVPVAVFLTFTLLCPILAGCSSIPVLPVSVPQNVPVVSALVYTKEVIPTRYGYRTRYVRRQMAGSYVTCIMCIQPIKLFCFKHPSAGLLSPQVECVPPASYISYFGRFSTGSYYRVIRSNARERRLYWRTNGSRDHKTHGVGVADTIRQAMTYKNTKFALKAGRQALQSAQTRENSKKTEAEAATEAPEEDGPRATASAATAPEEDDGLWEFIKLLLLDE